MLCGYLTTGAYVPTDRSRNEMIKKALSKLDSYDSMKELAKELHPDNVYMVIDEINVDIFIHAQLIQLKI